MTLKGKTVFITGASSGIGYSTAKEFAKKGCNLILTARREERLKELKTELEKENKDITVSIYKLDVNDYDRIKTISLEIKHLDILVNNAGLALGEDKLENVSKEVVDTVLDTNVKGLVYCAQFLIPLLRKSEFGQIINISSIAGKEAYPSGSIYCASKFAVDAITKTLRTELMDSNIRVCSINPGKVETEFSVVRFSGDKNKADNVYKGMKPLVSDDIAETIVFVASRPPHVEISDLTIFPHGQASATMLHKK